MRQLIDAHIHWWDLEKNSYPWLNGDTSNSRDQEEANVLAKNYLPQDLKDDVEPNTLVGAVHIEAGFDPLHPVEETRWLSQLNVDFPLAIIAAANLAKVNVNEVLAQHCQYEKVRGIRHILNYMADEPKFCWAEKDYLQDEQWLKNYKLLENHNLLFDLMCFSHQVPQFVELAQQVSGVPVVLEHTGMPQADSQAISQWKGAIKSLANCQHVSCKLGGLGTMIPDWGESVAFPFFDWVLDCFGPERIMFASNFPTDSQFCDYAYLMNAMEAWCSSRLTQDQQEHFFVGNAKRIYQF